MLELERLYTAISILDI